MDKKGQTLTKKIIIGAIGIFFLGFLIYEVFAQVNITQIYPSGNTTTNESFFNISKNISIDGGDVINNISININSIQLLYGKDLALYCNFDNRSEIVEDNSNANCWYFNGYQNGSIRYGATPGSNGKFGGSLDFHGTNSTTAGEDLRLINPINDSKYWTIGLWVKPKNTVHADNNEVLHWSWNRITYNDGSTNFNVNIYNGSDYSLSASGSGYIGSDGWVHITITRNDTEFKTYMNGVLGRTRTVAGTIGTDNYIYLGSRQTGFPQYEYLNFNGSIDEFVIFNRTLSGDEVNLMYSSSLTKYNGANYNLYMNNSLNYSSLILNASNPSKLYNFTVCVNNGTDTCSAEQSVTQVLKSKTISSNFSSLIGNINPFPYGSNVHNNRFSMGGIYSVDTNYDGVVDSPGNYTEHANAYINSGMNYQRGDASLGSMYNGVENPSFEYWKNSTLKNVSDEERAWGWTSEGLSSSYAWVSPCSTDSHSGNKSMNITGNAGTNWVLAANFGGDTTYNLSEGYRYNISFWVKGNITARIGIQEVGGSYLSCGGASFYQFTINDTTGWNQINYSCFISTPSSYEYRIVMDNIAYNEYVLIDDFSFYRNDTPFNWWFEKDSSAVAYLNYSIEHFKWIRDNNMRYMSIIDYMPRFLANRSANCVSSENDTDTGDCPPYNYDIYGKIATDYINRTTQNDSSVQDVLDVAIWNEPEIGFWCDQVSTDNIFKALTYVELYNASEFNLKQAFPNLCVGGTGASGQYRYNMQTSFMSNFSNRMCFYDFHRYSDTADTTIKTDLQQVFANCTLYSANCSRVILSEWQLSGGGYDETDNFISKVIASSYIMGLTNYPRNLTWVTYQWTESYAYGHGSSEYPSNWAMYLESQINNGTETFRPQYNVTQKFAELCSENGGSYSTSDIDNSTASCKKGDEYAIISVNLNSYSQNNTICAGSDYPYNNLTNTLTGEVYTLSGAENCFNIVQDSYQSTSISNILYLSSGVPPTITDITPTDFTNTTSTSINFTANLTDDVGLANSTLYILNTSGGNILQSFFTNYVSGEKSVIASVVQTLVDGWYKFWWWLWDDEGKSTTSGNYTLTVDTITPKIAFISPTEANNSYKIQNFIYANVSLNETNLYNVTFRLYYENQTILNTTTYTDSRRSINWTNLADGFYYYNATTFDTVNHSNVTQTYKIKLDNVIPTIQITNPRWGITEYSDTTNFYFNTSETTICSYSLDGSTNTSITASDNKTYSKSSILSNGLHTFYVFCNDTAGNQNVSGAYILFEVQHKYPGTGSTGGTTSGEENTTETETPTNETTTYEDTSGSTTQSDENKIWGIDIRVLIVGMFIAFVFLLILVIAIVDSIRSHKKR